eukprot:4653038-Pyramimonas_sp.AAC.1
MLYRTTCRGYARGNGTVPRRLQSRGEVGGACVRLPVDRWHPHRIDPQLNERHSHCAYIGVRDDM